MPRAYTDAEFIEAFWAKVLKTPTCWIWTGSGDKYGKVWYKGKLVGAHRVSWFLTYGYWPFETDHLCRDKKCVRPGHLEEVSRSQNLMRIRGTDTHFACGHVRDVVTISRDGRCAVCYS